MASRSLDASSSVSDGNAHKAASDLLHRPERASSSVPVLGRALDGADLQDHDADGVRHDVMGLAPPARSPRARDGEEHGEDEVARRARRVVVTDGRRPARDDGEADPRLDGIGTLPSRSVAARPATYTLLAKTTSRPSTKDRARRASQTVTGAPNGKRRQPSGGSTTSATAGAVNLGIFLAWVQGRRPTRVKWIRLAPRARPAGHQPEAREASVSLTHSRP
jgi:hypothetical protein